jgi:hypothetical protein
MPRKPFQSLIRGLGSVELIIGEKDVFPGTPRNGTGLKSRQIRAETGKHLQRLSQAAGTVLHGESEAHLVRFWVRPDFCAPAHQKKTRVVLWIVLNVSKENLAAIMSGRLSARDSRHGGVAQLH